MIPQPNRAAGNRQLAAFVASAGSQYTRTRNFDFGPGRRGNVSSLSPYVRHRLLLEQEILAETLAFHSPAVAGKFIEEIFWRAYFKGWLEHRPSVWTDYRSDLSGHIAGLDNDPSMLERYEAATTGSTGIDCVDAWATELVRTGYLHNHARMWFASIWVYTLKLPWQLGADFFLRHLIDGDPAANTLSWRWVCGLHTRGKTYLARVSNIANYTDNRFNPQGQLAISAPPLTESRVHPPRDLPADERLPDDGRYGLLITEEDCVPETLADGLAPSAILGAVATRLRSPLPIGLPTQDFASAAVADATRRAGSHWAIDAQLADSTAWTAMLTEWATAERLDTIVTAYAPVGPVAELLTVAQKGLERYGVRIVQLRRPYDSIAWPHARRGYFKLKQRIPAILDSLGIATVDDDARSKAV